MYVYSALLYMYCVYVLCVHKHKSVFFSTTKSLLLINALYNTEQNIFHISTFLKNEFFPTMAVEQRQHVDLARYCTFYSDLIRMFFFDTLHIPSG